MKRKLSIVVAGMATLALMLVLAACGSDSSSDSSTTSTSTGGGASKQAAASPALAGKEPLRIGFVCSCSGFAASSNGSMPALVEAWVKYTNSHGGLNGYPVKSFYKDDANDASTALQSVKTLVEKEHVQAIVNVSSQDQAFAKYVASKNVPVIGGQSQNPEFSSNPDFFPTGGASLTSSAWALPTIAKAAGQTKIGVMVCAEAPICAGFIKPFGKTLTDVVGGMSMVYSATIAANAPNYTSQCLAAKGKGAQAMLIGNVLTVVQRVIDGCAQQGVKLAYYVPTAPLPFVFKDPNMDGLVTVLYNAPITQTSLPGVKKFMDILQQYAPEVPKSDSWSSLLMGPYSGLEMFALNVTTNKTLTPTSTPAEVRDALYNVPATTLGGIAPTLKYVKGKPTNVPCWFASKIQGGKEVPLDGAKSSCLPPAKAAGFYKLWTAR